MEEKDRPSLALAIRIAKALRYVAADSAESPTPPESPVLLLHVRWMQDVSTCLSEFGTMLDSMQCIDDALFHLSMPLFLAHLKCLEMFQATLKRSSPRHEGFLLSVALRFASIRQMLRGQELSPLHNFSLGRMVNCSIELVLGVLERQPNSALIRSALHVLLVLFDVKSHLSSADAIASRVPSFADVISDSESLAFQGFGDAYAVPGEPQDLLMSASEGIRDKLLQPSIRHDVSSDVNASNVELEASDESGSDDGDGMDNTDVDSGLDINAIEHDDESASAFKSSEASRDSVVQIFLEACNGGERLLRTCCNRLKDLSVASNIDDAISDTNHVLRLVYQNLPNQMPHLVPNYIEILECALQLLSSLSAAAIHRASGILKKVQALIERCCDLVRVNESNRVSSSIVSLISSAAVLDMFLVRELQGLEEIRSLTVPAILAQKGQRQSPLALERPGEPAFCVLDSVVQSVQIFAAPIRWAVLQARRIFADPRTLHPRLSFGPSTVAMLSKLSLLSRLDCSHVTSVLFYVKLTLGTNDGAAQSGLLKRLALCTIVLITKASSGSIAQNESSEVQHLLSVCSSLLSLFLMLLKVPSEVSGLDDCLRNAFGDDELDVLACLSLQRAALPEKIARLVLDTVGALAAQSWFDQRLRRRFVSHALLPSWNVALPPHTCLCLLLVLSGPNSAAPRAFVYEALQQHLNSLVLNAKSTTTTEGAIISLLGFAVCLLLAEPEASVRISICVRFVHTMILKTNSNFSEVVEHASDAWTALLLLIDFCLTRAQCCPPPLSHAQLVALYNECIACAHLSDLVAILRRPTLRPAAAVAATQLPTPPPLAMNCDAAFERVWHLLLEVSRVMMKRTALPPPPQQALHWLSLSSILLTLGAWTHERPPRFVELCRGGPLDTSHPIALHAIRHCSSELRARSPLPLLPAEPLLWLMDAVASVRALLASQSDDDCAAAGSWWLHYAVDAAVQEVAHMLLLLPQPLADDDDDDDIDPAAPSEALRIEGGSFGKFDWVSIEMFVSELIELLIVYAARVRSQARRILQPATMNPREHAMALCAEYLPPGTLPSQHSFAAITVAVDVSSDADEKMDPCRSLADVWQQLDETYAPNGAEYEPQQHELQSLRVVTRTLLRTLVLCGCTWPRLWCLPPPHTQLQPLLRTALGTFCDSALLAFTADLTTELLRKIDAVSLPDEMRLIHLHEVMRDILPSSSNKQRQRVRKKAKRSQDLAESALFEVLRYLRSRSMLQLSNLYSGAGGHQLLDALLNVFVSLSHSAPKIANVVLGILLFIVPVSSGADERCDLIYRSTMSALCRNPAALQTLLEMWSAMDDASTLRLRIAEQSWTLLRRLLQDRDDGVYGNEEVQLCRSLLEVGSSSLSLPVSPAGLYALLSVLIRASTHLLDDGFAWITSILATPFASLGDNAATVCVLDAIDALLELSFDDRFPVFTCCSTASFYTCHSCSAALYCSACATHCHRNRGHDVVFESSDARGRFCSCNSSSSCSCRAISALCKTSKTMWRKSIRDRSHRVLRLLRSADEHAPIAFLLDSLESVVRDRLHRIAQPLSLSDATARSHFRQLDEVVQTFVLSGESPINALLTSTDRAAAGARSSISKDFNDLVRKFRPTRRVFALVSPHLMVAASSATLAAGTGTVAGFECDRPHCWLPPNLGSHSSKINSHNNSICGGSAMIPVGALHPAGSSLMPFPVLGVLLSHDDRLLAVYGVDALHVLELDKGGRRVGRIVVDLALASDDDCILDVCWLGALLAITSASSVRLFDLKSCAMPLLTAVPPPATKLRASAFVPLASQDTYALLMLSVAGVVLSHSPVNVHDRVVEPLLVHNAMAIALPGAVVAAGGSAGIGVALHYSTTLRRLCATWKNAGSFLLELASDGASQLLNTVALPLRFSHAQQQQQQHEQKKHRPKQPAHIVIVTQWIDISGAHDMLAGTVALANGRRAPMILQLDSSSRMVLARYFPTSSPSISVIDASPSIRRFGVAALLDDGSVLMLSHQPSGEGQAQLLPLPLFQSFMSPPDPSAQQTTGSGGDCAEWTAVDASVFEHSHVAYRLSMCDEDERRGVRALGTTLRPDHIALTIEPDVPVQHVVVGLRLRLDCFSESLVLYLPQLERRIVLSASSRSRWFDVALSRHESTVLQGSAASSVLLLLRLHWLCEDKHSDLEPPLQCLEVHSLRRAVFQQPSLQHAPSSTYHWPWQLPVSPLVRDAELSDAQTLVSALRVCLRFTTLLEHAREAPYEVKESSCERHLRTVLSRIVGLVLDSLGQPCYSRVEVVFQQLLMEALPLLSPYVDASSLLPSLHTAMSLAGRAGLTLVLMCFHSRLELSSCRRCPHSTIDFVRCVDGALSLMGTAPNAFACLLLALPLLQEILAVARELCLSWYIPSERVDDLLHPVLELVCNSAVLVQELAQHTQEESATALFNACSAFLLDCLKSPIESVVAAASPLLVSAFASQPQRMVLKAAEESIGSPPAQGQQKHHHPNQKQEQKEPQQQQEQQRLVRYRCDVCKVSPIDGERYHCTDAACDDFDICRSCFLAGSFPASPHTTAHTVNRIEALPGRPARSRSRFHLVPR